MQNAHQAKQFTCGKARVRIFDSAVGLGDAAAAEAAQIIQTAIETRGKARIIVATGNSQIYLIAALIKEKIDWRRVEVFHMDEYAGMPETHSASFRRWLRTRLANVTHPNTTHYLAGDAFDLDVEMFRYTKLLREAPIDLAFVGFGENGHIAFNDPHTADFEEPLTVKRVLLDQACRRQQAGEGHFGTVEEVPLEAVTITCPGLLLAENWVCCVPDKRKAEAVRNALEGPISASCPASIVRVHPRAYVYLDTESSSRLSESTMSDGSL